MQRRLWAAATTAVTALALAPSARADGPPVWRVVEGRTTIHVDAKTLARGDLSVFQTEKAASPNPVSRRGHAATALTFTIDRTSDLKFAMDAGSIAVLGGRILHTGGFSVHAGDQVHPFTTFALVPDSSDGYLEWLAAVDEAAASKARLLFRDTNIAVDPIARRMVITSDSLLLSPELAEALGHPERSGRTIASARIDAKLEEVIESDAVMGPTPLDYLSPGVGTAAGTAVIGPDVIVWDMPSINSYPAANGISPYSIATTSCNIGDAPASWVANTTEHPVIAQHMYRLRDNRLEQIGMSWVKHGFATVPVGAQCSTNCQDVPNNGTDLLFPGCSDPYSAMLNGAQNNLGPRSQIDAYTGTFPFPRVVSNPTCTGCGSAERRIQVANTDLDPALNAGALYFIETQYITHDDAIAGNDENNLSFRPFTVEAPAPPCIPGVLYCARVSSRDPTVVQRPAIRAWKARDAQVVETEMRVTGEGLFLLAARAFPVAGAWQYEYAIENINSDRAARSFSVPLPPGVNPQAVLLTAGFHGVERHSGEPYGTIPCAKCSNNTSKFCVSELNCPADRGPCLANGTCANNSAISCTTEVDCPFNYAPCVPDDTPCFDGVCSGATGFCEKPACTSDADCFGAACDTQTGKCDQRWAATVANGMLTWSTTDVEVDPLANALRWGQLFNFWFLIDSPPANTVVDLGLFTIGNPNRVLADTVGPALTIVDCQPNGVEDACDLDCAAPGCVPPCETSQDCNGNGRPDECELDCDQNGVADECELRFCVGGSNAGLACVADPGCPGGTCTGSNDCDGDGLLDPCEDDCDGDGIPDDCDTPHDADADGVEDCADLCRFTTPAGTCVCPDNGCCYFPFDPGTCFVFTRQDCLNSGGTPECVEPPCRDGCLLGDFDLDGDLDLHDAWRLPPCFSGAIGQPGFVSPSAECLLRFDKNRDGDVDATDYVEFNRLQGLYPGP